MPDDTPKKKQITNIILFSCFVGLLQVTCLEMKPYGSMASVILIPNVRIKQLLDERSSSLSANFMSLQCSTRLYIN